MSALTVNTLVSLLGFLAGVVFGATAQRTNFCTMGAISDIVYLQDYRRFRAWLLAIAVAIAVAQWRRGDRLERQLEAAAADLEQLQLTCSRLAPAGVVQRLLADGTDAATTPERKVVTALFADLVGYTALSERLEPVVLARVLNG